MCTFLQFSRTFLSAIIILFAAGACRVASAAPSGESLLLLASGADAGSQYVTLTSQGFFVLTSYSSSVIHVTSITSVSSDAANGYFRITSVMPINVRANDTAHVDFLFAPNAPDIISGERSYTATFTIASDATNNPPSAVVNGTGVLVRAATSIGVAFKGKVGDTIITPIRIDTWNDPLGRADVRGYNMELLHYRRTIVAVDKKYNSGGAGQANTLSAGATVVEDTATDNKTDPGHTSGQQGFYSLVVTNIPSPISAAGTLMNLRFFGVKGTDTSQLTYRVSNFINAEGLPQAYVIVTNSDGLIHIDSVKKVDTILAVRQLAQSGPAQNAIVLHANAPNPFAAATDIGFTLAERGRAELYVCDVRGRIVSTLVNGELAAGDHHSQFSAGALPSGQYYAVLRTASGLVSQEMALVR